MADVIAMETDPRLNQLKVTREQLAGVGHVMQLMVAQDDLHADFSLTREAWNRLRDEIEAGFAELDTPLVDACLITYRSGQQRLYYSPVQRTSVVVSQHGLQMREGVQIGGKVLAIQRAETGRTIARVVGRLIGIDKGRGKVEWEYEGKTYCEAYDLESIFPICPKQSEVETT